MIGKYWYLFDNVKTDSKEAEITLWLSLPQNYRNTLITTYDFSPRPFKIVTDEYGLNNVALWRIKDIKDNRIAVKFGFNITKSNKQIKEAISQKERERFLRSEQWIDITSDIINTAKEVTQFIFGIKEKAFALFDWVVENIKYEYPDIGHRGTKCSFAVKKGDCGEFSVIYCALCRAIGIPARTVTCLWYNSSGHQWSEMYIDDEGWVPVDTSLAKELKYPYSIITNKDRRDGFIEELGLNGKEYTYLFGNTYKNTLVVYRGNNNTYNYEESGLTRTFVYMQPGGMSAFPNGYEFKNLDTHIVHGGLLDFSNQPIEEIFKRFRKESAERYLQNGLVEEGIEGLKTRLIANEHDTEALFYLGSIYFEMKQYEKAEIYLHESLSYLGGSTKVVNDTWANIQLGQIHDIRNERSKAVEYYKRSLKLGIDYAGSLAIVNKYLIKPYVNTGNDVEKDTSIGKNFA